MSDKIFLDTNVLVYAHDSSEPDKKDKSQKLIFDGLRAKTVVISTQVLSEFFVTITQKVKHPLTVARARNEIELLSHLETVEIDVDLVIHAIDLKQRWMVNYWDALILAASERAGCHVVYSEDMSDRQTYGKLIVHNPFK